MRTGVVIEGLLRKALRRTLRRYARLRGLFQAAEFTVERIKHTLASRYPELIVPQPRKMTVAVTAQCNLRCVGCRYGRDFMPGSQLSLQTVKVLLDDAREAGIRTVRLYGGEPLLHPDLPKMVEHSIRLGMSTYVTTNGILLDRHIVDLYNAGLRDVTIGYYGTGSVYDAYVQRSERFLALERSVDFVRQKYGNLCAMQLNFLLMRPSCNIEAIRAAWSFAEKYDLTFRTDLIHYSLPYFSEGPDRVLQFTADDRPSVQTVVEELLRLKAQYPSRLVEADESLRSITDWVMKGPEMLVPCDARKLIWIGADGTVQLCYVTFKLGNINQGRLRDFLFTDEHKKASRDAFLLNCPNCHCERQERILKHSPSRRLYSITSHQPIHTGERILSTGGRG